MSDLSHNKAVLLHICGDCDPEWCPFDHQACREHRVVVAGFVSREEAEAAPCVDCGRPASAHQGSGGSIKAGQGPGSGGLPPGGE